MNLNELINKKIEERIDEALEKYFSEPEETNVPAPEKSEHDIYMEEFTLLQSRPGLTRKELREDKRWQEFLAKRPGPKMEIVYNDYLCHLERERLTQENADLRQRLAEANADLANLNLNVSKRIDTENGELKSSTPVELYPVPRMIYANLKKFIAEQKLTQAEFIELIGIRKKSSKHANQVYASAVINGERKKNLDKFWKAVKKTFDLTNEQLSELKKTEEAK